MASTVEERIAVPVEVALADGRSRTDSVRVVGAVRTEQSHLNERMVAGSRPQPAGAGYSYDPDSPDMEEPMDRAAMSYRRADGTQRQRHVPEVGV